MWLCRCVTCMNVIALREEERPSDAHQGWWQGGALASEACGLCGGCQDSAAGKGAQGTCLCFHGDGMSACLLVFSWWWNICLSTCFFMVMECLCTSLLFLYLFSGPSITLHSRRQFDFSKCSTFVCSFSIRNNVNWINLFQFPNLAIIEHFW